MDSFFNDLMDVHRQNRRRINRGLNLDVISRMSPEARMREFCQDPHGGLVYEHLCCLALLFSNAMGKHMPDHIHARMILGEPNRWVSKYLLYVDSLRPHFLMYNPNKNNFRSHTIGPCGWLKKMVMK